MIRVDAEKLKAVIARRGFSNYEAVAERALGMGIKLGLATIYNIANNENWTRDKLEALCQVVGCDPRDFVYFEHVGPKASAPIRQNGARVNIPA